MSDKGSIIGLELILIIMLGGLQIQIVLAKEAICKAIRELKEKP